jgi:hypothetical protein
MAGPRSRPTTKYGLFFAATQVPGKLCLLGGTLWDGGDFPDCCVARRSKTPGILHSLLLALGKILFRRCRPVSE